MTASTVVPFRAPSAIVLADALSQIGRSLQRLRTGVRDESLEANANSLKSYAGYAADGLLTACGLLGHAVRTQGEDMPSVAGLIAEALNDSMFRLESGISELAREPGDSIGAFMLGIAIEVDQLLTEASGQPGASA